jgi:adenosylcobinamide kinase / adenosylcobinamide-phosphate guanylyltransferase
MEVQLLGTSAADGWPNPFCSCDSCQTVRTRGIVRGQTSVLVDGTVLLDCGPETPGAASRAGRDLVGVRHVLLTHSHPDHAAPAVLLWRSWAGRREPLDVIGPADAVALFRDWVGADDVVQLQPVRPGDTVTVGSYAVRVLAADHEVETVAYDVTGPDGSRLLYATDTGPLPQQTLEDVAGRAYQLVLLEETFGDRHDHGSRHLDLATFGVLLDALRAKDAVVADTDVVAVHLGHHNPPDIDERLVPYGARTVVDGTTLHVDPRGDVRRTTVPPRRVLVLGGARSGKSRYAEALLASSGSVEYVATGGVRSDDRDWQERIAAHQARRPATWTTVETTDLERLLRSPGPPLLIDCLTLWLTDALDAARDWATESWLPGGEKAYLERVDKLVGAYAESRRLVVAVSNEVGSGVVPSHSSGRLFRDELGRLNARIAAVADEAYLVVAGRPLRLPPGAGMLESSR